ncbi:MAG: NosD domain-containing protein, partial [Methanobacteriota archaeon]
FATCPDFAAERRIPESFPEPVEFSSRKFEVSTTAIPWITNVSGANGRLHGIAVVETSNFRLENSTGSGNDSGILLSAAKSGHVANDTATGGIVGIRLVASEELVVRDAKVAGNVGVLVSPDGSRRNRVFATQAGGVRAVPVGDATAAGSLPQNLIVDAGLDATATWGVPHAFAGAVVASFSPAEPVTAQEWEFGDGTREYSNGTAAVLRPTKNYSAVGTFQATLRATIGGRTYNDTVEVRVLPARPGPVANLTAANLSGAVSLSWSRPAALGGAAGVSYRVFRAVGTGPEALVRNGSNETTFRDANVTDGATYHYRVVAYHEGGEAPAVSVSARPTGAPGVPGNVTVTLEGGLPRLSWRAPASDGGEPVLEYVVFRGVGGGGFDVVGNTTTTAFADALLGNLRPAEYRVAARNVRGTGPMSPAVALVLSGLPTAPEGLRVESDVNGTRIAWSASPNGTPPVLGSRLYRAGPSGVFERLAELSATANGTEDLRREPGVVYRYALAAYNAAAEGPRAVSSPVPPRLAAVTAGATVSGVRLTFDLGNGTGNGTGNGSFGAFRILRIGPDGNITVLRAPSNATSFDDTGVVPGTRYTYRVMAETDAAAGEPTDAD